MTVRAAQSSYLLLARGSAVKVNQEPGHGACSSLDRRSVLARNTFFPALGYI